MSNAKHTRGPWTIEEYGDDDCPALVIHKDTETRVCFMATPGSHGDPAKIAADAKLICAAPELLAAGRDVLASGENSARLRPDANSDVVISGPAWTALRAAIAKAEGGAS